MLGDPFEGSLTVPAATMYQRILDARRRGEDVGSWNEVSDEILINLQNSRSTTIPKIGKTMFINCWHVNDHESAGMWRLYSNGDPIVAVQTTYHRLSDLFPAQVQLGMVNYVDYETAELPQDNVFYPYTHKRLSFQHENEIRGVIWDIENPSEALSADQTIDFRTGIYINMDISAMIERIYVDPTAPAWFLDVVNNVCRDMELNIPIVSSRLSERPVF